MKATNKVSALSLVVEQLTTEKSFDSINVVQCLAREIIGFNKSSDKLAELQKQIDDVKIDKGARKKAIDGLLKELWANNVTMVVGKGVTKCVIRIALKEVLTKEGLSEKTVSNIIGAVSYALNNKKPYDIKYLEKAAIEKKIIAASTPTATTPTATTPTATTPTATTPTATTPTATTPTATTPTATTPTATTPTATTPTATTPTATTPTAKKPNDKTQYIKDMAILCQNAIQASESRRMLKDEHQQVYADIIELFNEVMDHMGSLK